MKTGLTARLQALTKQKSQVGGVARRTSLMAPNQLGNLSNRQASTSNEGSAAEITLMKSNSLNKTKTILIRKSTLNEAEKESNWTDRLRQWKQVSQSAGAVTSFDDQKLETIQSSAFAVLGVLQASISSQDLQDKVE